MMNLVESVLIFPMAFFNTVVTQLDGIIFVLGCLFALGFAFVYLIILGCIAYGIFYIFACIKDRNLKQMECVTDTELVFTPAHGVTHIQNNSDGTITTSLRHVPDYYEVKFVVHKEQCKYSITKEVYQAREHLKNRVEVIYRKGMILHIDNWKFI